MEKSYRLKKALGLPQNVQWILLVSDDKEEPTMFDEVREGGGHP